MLNENELQDMREETLRELLAEEREEKLKLEASLAAFEMMIIERNDRIRELEKDLTHWKQKAYRQWNMLTPEDND